MPSQRTGADDRVMLAGLDHKAKSKGGSGLELWGCFPTQFFKAIFITFVCDVVWHGVPQTVVAGRRPRESVLSLPRSVGSRD